MPITATRSFKIFLIFAIVAAALSSFLYVTQYAPYARLRAVAKTLPSYQGTDISSGIKGERDCYAVDDRSSCTALIINAKAKADSDTSSAIEAFIAATEKTGIAWPEYKDGAKSIDSNMFVRDGRSYQIDIASDRNGSTSVALLAY
jgi:hypothetical protein